MKFRTPVVATELRLPGQGTRAVGLNGEINAGSKKELMLQVAKLLELAGTSEIISESEAQRRAEKASLQRDLMVASFRDGAVHKELGEIMADDLYLAANRDGFARRFLIKQDLTQGQIPRVKLRTKGVTAALAASPVKVETQLTNDLQFYAPEFDLVSRPFVTKREIDQSVSDVVDEKYVEGLESIMVTEDRTWKSMADKLVNVDNALTNVAGNFNPAALMSVRNKVNAWNISARFLLMANDLWTDIASDSSWANVIDQVSKHEVLLTGQLGTVYGMDIISDAFRHPAHKVLSQGEFYVIGDPINHGAMSDRGGVESTPTDISVEGTPGKGWVLVETISMVIANSRSIAKGVR